MVGRSTCACDGKPFLGFRWLCHTRQTNVEGGYQNTVQQSTRPCRLVGVGSAFQSSLARGGLFHALKLLGTQPGEYALLDCGKDLHL